MTSCRYQIHVAAILLALFLAAIASTSTAQTFQYSRGWVNGKRSAGGTTATPPPALHGPLNPRQNGPRSGWNAPLLLTRPCPPQLKNGAHQNVEDQVLALEEWFYGLLSTIASSTPLSPVELAELPSKSQADSPDYSM